jgi:hypothetical protein
VYIIKHAAADTQLETQEREKREEDLRAAQWMADTQFTDVVSEGY